MGISTLTRRVASKRSRGLPLDLAGLLPGMLRARTGGCAPLSSRSFAASLSRPCQVYRGSIRGVCAVPRVSLSPGAPGRPARYDRYRGPGPRFLTNPRSSLAPSPDSCTIRMHHSAPENGNRNWYVAA